MTVDRDIFERAQANGTVLDESLDVMRKELSEMLGVSEIGRTVVGVEMFGRGPAASVDVRLSGDTTVTFERFSDITKGPTLTAYLASYGVARTFKADKAALIGALIAKLAKHHKTATMDEIAREWGSEFLRLAPVQEFELDDQVERWRAFSSLQGLNPGTETNEDRSAFALAQAAVVLQDKTTGVRLVRAGWFLSYVRREAGVYNAATLDTQMERVGWERSGGEGKIKATSPDGQRTINWRFYKVSKGWEER